MASPTEENLMELLQAKFPGMEGYFINKYTKTHKGSIIQGKWRTWPHVAHSGFIYCGVVDCYIEPYVTRVWRSTSIAGLMRLLLAENPDFVPPVTYQEHKRWSM